MCTVSAQSWVATVLSIWWGMLPVIRMWHACRAWPLSYARGGCLGCKIAECLVAAGNFAHLQLRGLVTCDITGGLPRCVGLCLRLLVYRERPLPASLCLLLFWRPRGEPCWRQRRMRIFHVSNTDQSGSCVPNSGLRSEKIFLKGAGYQRKLCSVEPQLQQRPLYCTQD